MTDIDICHPVSWFYKAGMRLKKRPSQPAWNPIYAHSDVRVESWAKFISETYWNVTLEK